MPLPPPERCCMRGDAEQGKEIGRSSFSPCFFKGKTGITEVKGPRESVGPVRTEQGVALTRDPALDGFRGKVFS